MSLFRKPAQNNAELHLKLDVVNTESKYKDKLKLMLKLNLNKI